MKCNRCGETMDVGYFYVHAGKSWHSRDCVKHFCFHCKKEYTIETTNFILKLMLKCIKCLEELENE